MPLLAASLLILSNLQPEPIDLEAPPGRVYALTEHRSGDLVVFTHHPPGAAPVLMQRQRGADGNWSSPRPVPFGDPAGDADSYFQPGTDRLVFMSQRDTEPANWDIWEVEWTSESWSEARPITAINGPDSDIYPTVSADGMIAMATTREGTGGDRQIWLARPSEGGGYVVGPATGALNSDPRVSNPLIFPDGDRVIVFQNLDDGFGGPDLALSCRTDDGWTAPVNLGAVVNTAAAEYAPMLNADGSELNFVRDDTLLRIAVADLGAAMDCPSQTDLQDQRGD